MSNMICFNYKSDKDDFKDDLNMSNGGTSVFINIICLSGGGLAETESQKRLMGVKLKLKAFSTSTVLVMGCNVG